MRTPNLCDRASNADLSRRPVGRIASRMDGVRSSRDVLHDRVEESVPSTDRVDGYPRGAERA